MTVGDIINLISYNTHYEVIGAMTGKKVFDSYNKKETREKYYDLEVSETPLFTKMKTHKNADYAYPVLCIWVLGK